MLSSIIAFLALLVSLAVLVVQYRNQLERRHAEIVQLRMQMITALSSIAQRVASLHFNAEIMRIELRRLPDTPDKWSSIEMIPVLLAEATKLKNEIDKLVVQLERIDTQKANRSETLLMLQGEAAILQKFVPVAENGEKKMLLLLASVRNENHP